MPSGIYILLAGVFILHSPAQGQSQVIEDATQALLQASARWTWPASAASVGWQQSTPLHVCNWTGIVCDESVGLPTNITLQGVGISGSLGLDSLARVSSLESVVLSSNQLSGTLPTTLAAGFPRLQTLDLSYNNINGPLPEDWAASGAFPKLELLDLYQNPIGGVLPAWNATGVGLRSLTTLSLGNSNMSGTLHASWSENLRHLRSINIANTGFQQFSISNSLTGTLPDDWYRLDLVSLSLTFNSLVGTMPSSWGANWRNIETLQLDQNLLTGTIPSVWGENGSLALLAPSNGPNAGTTACNLGANMLSGSLPVAFTSTVHAAILLPGNARLCGAPSPGFEVVNATSPGGTSAGTRWGSSGGRWQLQHPDIPASRLPFLSCEVAGAMSTLFNDFNNFLQVVARQYIGWQQVSGTVSTQSLRTDMGYDWTRTAVPACRLFGVQCSQQGAVSGLNFSGLGLTGSFGEGWEGFASLASLNFSSNSINGTLPAYWGPTFGNLTTLDLSENSLTGTVPDEWTEEGAFRQLELLNLTINSGINGSLPGFSDSTGAPAIAYLWLQECNFSGALPDQWAGLSELRQVGVGNNSLSSTLPPSWGSSAALPQMQLLLASNNHLSGTLPASWDSPGSFPSLQQLQLGGNDFSGTIPPWRDAGGMPQLSTAGLLPLGAASTLCGPYPPPLPVINETSGQPPTQSLPSCPSDPVLPEADRAKDAGVSGAAIAGIIIGAVAALAAAGSLAFLIRRRRLRKDVSKKGKVLQYSESQQASGSSGPGDATYAVVLEVSPKHQSLLAFSSGIPKVRAIAASHSGPNPFLEGFSLSTLDFDPEPAILASSSVQSDVPFDDSSKPTEQTLGSNLPDVTFDWRIEPGRIAILKRPDGTEWRLGQGGFGTVFLGLMDGVHECAVKVLSVLDTANPAQREGLAREISIMRACRAKHITNFFGAWLSKDLVFLVQEYMEGGDLYHALSHPKIGPELSWYKRGRSIALDVAKGLFYLHTNGVLHRDIKSPNILLSKGSLTAKISDVGLAQLLTTTSALPRTTAGTYDWQAPEVLLGTHTSFPADIWSFGVCCLEIISGEPQRRGRYSEPRWPAQCPQEICSLVKACMHLDPEQRPNAKQVVASIRASQPQHRS